MLAKDLKIKNIKKQREFIWYHLERMCEANKDGDVTFPYLGTVYPEVIKYYEDEGFVVTKVQNDELSARNQGVPVYLFTVSERITLSDEELERAEQEEGFNDDEPPARDALSNMLSRMMGPMGPMMP